MTPSDYRLYAAHQAEINGLNVEQFVGTLQCESGFDPSIHSNFYYKGKRENSWGIAQINLPAHLDVTKEQALDPFFSLAWMSAQWKLGNESIWSCYRSLYEKGST